jgi:hypothetical protein
MGVLNYFSKRVIRVVNQLEGKIWFWKSGG